MEIYTSALPVSGKAVHKNHIMNTFASATVKIGRVKGGGGEWGVVLLRVINRGRLLPVYKALGSDNQSVKFESLICVPPYYLNRK